MSDKLSIKERAEDAAAAYLERIGLTVAERGYTCEAGSVALVAFDGATIVLVDVVIRRSGAEEPMCSPTKRRRLRRVADSYIREHDLDGSEVRLDVIDIRVIAEGRALLRHHRALF